MRAGKLYNKIDLQRFTDTQDAHGQPIQTWTMLSARRAAWVMPVRGEERFTADQFIAREQVEFRIRYADIAADLNPLDRIIYPALETASPMPVPETHQIYDIMAVLPGVARNRELRILAARRAEQ